MGLVAIQGGVQDARETEKLLAMKLKNIGFELQEDVEAAQRISSHEESAIEKRRTMMIDASIRATKAIAEATQDCPGHLRADYQALSDRARLNEIRAILEGLSTNLGTYLD